MIYFDNAATTLKKPDGVAQAVSDAIEALAALGYSATEATKAVRKADTGEDTTVEELLKQSLKYLYS